MSARRRLRSPLGLPRAAAVLAACAVMAACDGGSGPIGVGSDQEPDPVVVEFPIAYTKGPLLDEDGQMQASTDMRRLLRFNVGTDLYLRDPSSPSSPERNVTLAETEGAGDVMGVQISADGRRVLFAMRGPFDPDLDDDEQPSWNIWEYDIAAEALRRIIASDINAEAGHDISPHYLPDGRIVFASTRQRQSKAILLDEGKPQFDALDEQRGEPAFVLHVMRDDGSEIEQISFSQSHDSSAAVLDDGRIVFSRWERIGGEDAVHLYTIAPDGTGLELLYGARSHATGTDGGRVQFAGAREMADGRISAILRELDHPDLGGDVVVIDARAYVENGQAIAPYAGLTGPAQGSATRNEVRTDAALSMGGRFASAFPLWDGTDRLLVAWSICRVITEELTRPCQEPYLSADDVARAPPLYGIWMYDPAQHTQLPVVIGEENVLIADVAAAQPRRRPTTQPTLVEHPALVDQGLGVLNIRSVYDIGGVDTAEPDITTLADPGLTTATDRPARFLRVVKPVSIPGEELLDLPDSAFGVSTDQGMREILGYAPIEPDGSVRITLPADVAFAVEVLDEHGRRTSSRHGSWLQVRPGEERRCNGCHLADSGLSHGRRDSFESVYAGSLNPTGPFPGTDPAWFTDFGETMAETRSRIDPVALTPSVDLRYEDVWTDSASRAPDAPLARPYVTTEHGPDGFQTPASCDQSSPSCFAGLVTPAPATAECIAAWHPGCRIVIHYETHIHPLWSAERTVLAADGVTVLEDNTCTDCHAGAAPAGQLSLADGQSAEQPAHLDAYRQLLLNEPAPMSADGAADSNRFFSHFDPGGSHEGYLSGAELRLIAEWLDIGAQYYNNPFDAPVQ